MTTIAIDALGNIAADSRATCGNEISRDDVDKIILTHGRIYALAGAGALTAPLIAWHHAGADPTKLPICKDCNWSLIVVDDNGIYCYNDRVPYAVANAYEPPVAFGSGQDWALGAMLAGKSAKEAVEIACKVDINSGGKVMAVNIADTLAPKLKEAAE